MQDQEFIAEAVKRGFIRQDQVPGLLKTQQEIAAKGLNIELPQIMIMKGLITNAQADAIRSGDRPKTMTFGSYEIVGKIGEGGMGIVYKAFKTDQPDRPVALKILHQRAATDTESNLRFKREANILVQMKHPNIVAGYDFGEINSRLFIAMEYLDGKMLSKVIKERGVLEEKTILKIALDVAHALEFVHSQKLVHRDIKPDNVMICESGVAKLMDLGLAKTTAQEVSPLTAPGMAIGTPVYMSPEHIQGDRDLDIRTDFYGLGATLWHAVTGYKPFEGDNPFEVMRNKLEKPVPDPRIRRKEISTNCAMLLITMMCKDRNGRHATPAELIEDIRKVLMGQPPSRAPSQPVKRATVVREAPAQPQRPTQRRVAEAQPSQIPVPKASTRRTVHGTMHAKKPAVSPVAIVLIIAILLFAGAMAFVLNRKGVIKFGRLKPEPGCPIIDDRKENRWESSTG
jgi:serine/threonine-protein kinase